MKLFGFNRHRLKLDGYHNREVAFIKVMQKWKKHNNTIFDMAIFGSNQSMSPNDYLSDRETKIVASLIQWLGTPVGKNFLQEVDKMEEYFKPFTKKY